MDLNVTPTRPSFNGSRREMSASLHERLKRCSRYSDGPSNLPKRSCFNPSSISVLPDSSYQSNERFMGQTILKEGDFFQTPTSSKPFANLINSESGGIFKYEVQPTHRSFSTLTCKPSCQAISDSACFAQDILKQRLELENAQETSILNTASNSVSGTFSTAMIQCIDQIPSSRTLQLGTVDTSHIMSNSISSVKHQTDISSVDIEGEIKMSSPNGIRDIEFASNIVELSGLKNVELIAKNSLCPEECIMQKKDIMERIRHKEETLRKLNLVKMYRVKNDLNQLDLLTLKWKSVCQEALDDLLDYAPEPRPSMSQLIIQLQIDPQIVNYNSEDESFG